jgi:hypothetical protein
MRTRLGPLALLLFFVLAAGPVVPSVSAQTADDFFNGDALQEIRLAINSKDWNALRTNYLDNTYYPCDFTWNGITVRNVGIRSRGLGSRNSTKPGLRVDFDRYASQQKFLGLKSVILDNVTQDPSSMKERLTTMFLARMGQPASREAHVRLYVNNEFFALYVIVESVDKDFLQRTLGENDGYLFEYNYVYDWRLNYLGPELEKYKEVFDAKTREGESITSIYDPIERMVRTMNDASDASFESGMSAFLNLTDFTTHVALENVMAEWDGVLGYAGLNNFYFYRNATTGLSRFITWDKDNTFRSSTYFIREGIAGNVLARRLTGIQQYADHYYNVLKIGADAIDEPVAGLPEGTAPVSWLRYQIDRVYGQIRESMLADTAKPYTNDEFEASVEQLRAFAAERPVYLRCEVTKETSRDQAAVEAACKNAPTP